MIKFDPWFMAAVITYISNLVGWAIYAIYKGLS